MSFHPTNLQLIGADSLQVTWSDGAVHQLAVKFLRDHCPCATCREQRAAEPASQSLLPVLSLEETQPVKILGMRPVGNYAYGIQFSDGHDTGIFTLTFLRQLGENQSSPGGQDTSN